MARSAIHGAAPVFHHSSFSRTSFSPVSWRFDVVATPTPPTSGGTAEPARERIFREHWDYLDSLRELRVQVADDIHGVRTVSVPLDMKIPDALVEIMRIQPRAMRGKVTPPTVADVMDDPLILAALVMLVDDD